MAIHTDITAAQQQDYEMKKLMLERQLLQMRGMENPFYTGAATNAPSAQAKVLPALFTNRQRLLLLLTC